VKHGHIYYLDISFKLTLIIIKYNILTEIMIPIKNITFAKINKRYVNNKIDSRLEKYIFCAYLNI
jgi:hypothetical protein